jgi:ABC-2 type transport system permease protein
MIVRIARKEPTDILRDGRFRWVAAMALSLLLVSLALGFRHYRAVRADRDAAHVQAYEQWLNQGRRNAHSLAVQGSQCLPEED